MVVERRIAALVRSLGIASLTRSWVGEMAKDTGLRVTLPLAR